MGVSRYTWKTFVRELLLIVVAAFFLAPFYIVIVGSLKSNREALAQPLALPDDPQVTNFTTAWRGAGIGLGPALTSSLIITVCSILLLLLIGSLTGYVIARHESKLSNAAYVGVVVGIILPFQLAIIPMYAQMREFGLIGGYAGMIILYTGIFAPVSIFFYTTFIRSLPRDYEDAARVDGAGLLRTLFRVVLPLLGPVTGTVAVLSAVIIWNEFFLSLIFLSGSDYQTLPVALYSFVGEEISQWNLIFAAVVMTILPIIVFYLIAQRQLIKGFSGGVSG